VSQGQSGVISDLTPETARLRARVGGDPGCAEFPALADAERRAGRLEEALEVAEKGLRATPDRLAGRVALGLILLDLGKPELARGELAKIFENMPSPREAAPDVSPGNSTESRGGTTLRGGARAKGSLANRATPVDLPVGEGSAFRTRTMARLLESQGDRSRAEAILDGLDSPSVAPDDQAVGVGSSLLAPEADPSVRLAGGPDESAAETLDRWLQNVQRGRS
jgi:tetratricopeptide (TPR) repeat protein